MRAHGGIDAAGAAQVLAGRAAHDLLVQRLAHAVQALELVLAGLVAGRVGQVVDGGQGVGIVRGELGVDRIGRGQQLARAGQVGHIGIGLAGVDRVAFETVDLGALDLAVPVGALDQAHHQAVLAAAGQVDDEVQHIGAALLVGLHDKADACKTGQLGRKAEFFQQVQRQLQAVGFFGVDIEADVVAFGQHGQLQHHRVELGHHAVVLGAAVARVQGRQLDRDARAFVDAPAIAGLADRMDGVFVVAQVALGVIAGHCRLAQHVVGVAEALGLQALGILQRFANRLAGDELLAHHAHGHVHALADQRLAAPADQAGERLAQRAFAVRGHQLAGQHQAPGGGIDEHRRALAHVGLPLAVGDLVADQHIARGRIGDTQQRLGQAHQRNAFLRRQRKLLQQALHQAGAAAVGLALAQRAGQLQRQRIAGLGDGGGWRGLGQQCLQRFGLGLAVGGGDGRAQRRGGLQGRYQLIKNRSACARWAAARGRKWRGGGGLVVNNGVGSHGGLVFRVDSECRQCDRLWFEFLSIMWPILSEKFCP